MTTTPGSLPLAQDDAAALDYYRLRREGIGWIQQAGSDHWTDYNLHDPGITILEALAYALTDLAYRTEFPITDILASIASGTGADDPYPDQTFYSARTILTVNPTTSDDVRRLLIDVTPVRNAWVRSKTCGCDAPYFAWCDEDELVLSHDPSQRPGTSTEIVRVEPRGLTDVLLELEPDPDLGDLNDRKIVRRRVLTDADERRHVVTVEARFPPWELARRDDRARLADDDQPITLTVSGPNRTTTGTTPVDDAELRAHWFDVFYVDTTIELTDGTEIRIDNVSVRLFGSSTARDLLTVADLMAWLGETTADGFVEPYRRKLAVVDSGVAAARAALARHRNLDEDVCRVDLVDIAEVAVCADVEVDPAADIELVQARIWFEIQRYLDPVVEPRTLDELRGEGVRVESIFNGPELDNGFLTDEALAAGELRAELRVSDILDRLVDIDGVVSVEHLQLTAYGQDGTVMPGISDPTWSGATPLFDPERISASWLMFLPPKHRPRLHRRLSKFHFASNGLPFLPRTGEAEDTLVQLEGRSGRPKLRATDLDLPVPVGTRRDLQSYHPVQHSLPATYGLGPVGLPSGASPLRRAQAKQLKAYLMVFEQLLANGYQQVARVGDLFSLDPEVDHTYFSALDGPSQVVGYGDVVAGLTSDALERLTESPAVFVERRNRFLDHLLARFAESFDDLARQLATTEGSAAAGAALIDPKLAFLRRVPELGHDRGKAFDRTHAPCDPANISGLQRRVNLMLGLPEVSVTYEARRDAAAPGFTHRLRLHATVDVLLDPPPEVTAALVAVVADEQLDPLADWSLSTDGERFVLTRVRADNATEETTPDLAGAIGDLADQVRAARRTVLSSLTRAEPLTVTAADPQGPWRVGVADPTTGLSGDVDHEYPTEHAARDAVARITDAVAHARSILVEHLLLRPKFPGDALFPACAEGACCPGGDADPYSFRLTLVMPGWTAGLSTDISMRDFADRRIRAQTPSHLVVKTCWVGNDGFVRDPCDPLVGRLADLLDAATGDPDASCECATEVYELHATAFETWFTDHSLTPPSGPSLAEALVELFADEVDLSGVSCAAVLDDAVRDQLGELLVERFAEIARRGFQFERFHGAWCRWVEADATIDWADERLQGTVVELLTRAATTPGPGHEALCTCAATILARFGAAFHTWMVTNIDAGREPDGFTPFAAPGLAACPGVGFDAGLMSDLRELLIERYAGYVEVSYRLHLLLRALADLRNTYPRATLHDCDEGSDFNPVRLGHSALGSN